MSDAKLVELLMDAALPLEVLYCEGQTNPNPMIAPELYKAIEKAVLGLRTFATASHEAEPERKPIGWIPKWTYDQLTGSMGGASEWGVNTAIYRQDPNDRHVAIYADWQRKEGA